MEKRSFFKLFSRHTIRLATGQFALFVAVSAGCTFAWGVGPNYTVTVTTSAAAQGGTLAAAALSAGQTRAYTASLRDANNAPVSIGQSQFTWTVSNPRLATVTSDGVLTAKSTQIQSNVDVLATARLTGVTPSVFTGRASATILAAAAGGVAFEFSSSALDASGANVRVSVGQPQQLVVRVLKNGTPFTSQPEFTWTALPGTNGAVTLTDGLASQLTSASGVKNVVGTSIGRALYRVSAPVGVNGVVIAADVMIIVDAAATTTVPTKAGSS